MWSMKKCEILISVTSQKLDLSDTIRYVPIFNFYFSLYFAYSLLLGDVVIGSCPASPQFCPKQLFSYPESSKEQLSMELLFLSVPT